METAVKIAELLPKTMTQNSCAMSQQESHVVCTKDSSGQMAVSLYRDNEASPRDIAISMKRLELAFPKMEKGFFDLLAERVIANGFTASRLKDAVNHVLDNFQYKELNISDIIRFDRRVKLYTYSEVCQLVTSGKAVWEDFEKREINGTVFRIKKTDLI